MEEPLREAEKGLREGGGEPRGGIKEEVVSTGGRVLRNIYWLFSNEVLSATLQKHF